MARPSAASRSSWCLTLALPLSLSQLMVLPPELQATSPLAPHIFAYSPSANPWVIIGALGVHSAAGRHALRVHSMQCRQAPGYPTVAAYACPRGPSARVFTAPVLPRASLPWLALDAMRAARRSPLAATAPMPCPLGCAEQCRPWWLPAPQIRVGRRALRRRGAGHAGQGNHGPRARAPWRRAHRRAHGESRHGRHAPAAVRAET